LINQNLLHTEIQDYIRNFHGDISQIAFTGSPFPSISAAELIQQIESRRKAEKKLPTWFATPNILFPPKLNLEQTSSETTAKYKASIINGTTLADITGGFGVDAFFLAEKFNAVHHFEMNQQLSKLAEHNFNVLNRKNVKCFAEDGLDQALNHQYDVIYADPSRRHNSKGKVFFLKDCEPNIPENISLLLQQCNKLLLKTSPMLDLSVGLDELKNVVEIHVVAVENEVKELLWLLKKNSSEAPKIRTINFTKWGVQTFDFLWKTDAVGTLSVPKKYLFEPNAAILKSGAFQLVSERFNIGKLHKNTHLYTSDKLIDFPGRRFCIDKIIPYSKTEMRRANLRKANIATRNFPESVETLRKKWKIASGGEVYLFFTTTSDEKKQMLVCSKLKADSQL